MKKLLILLMVSFQSFAEDTPEQVDLDNISIHGLDKNVAKIFAQTKDLILESRQEKDKQSELLGTKKWCYLLHNFDFLEQAKNCYYLIGMDAKTEANWPYLYAKAALGQGNIEDAIKGFEQTIHREKNYLPAHYYLMQIAIEQGNLMQAFEFQSNVPANLKLTANMLNITGDLYTQVENYFVANGFYHQALTLAPQANSLNYKIARNHQVLDQIDLAEEFLKISGQIGISLPDPYYQQVKDTTVGEIPYLIKAKKALNNLDFKLAIIFYNKALEFNPKSKSAQTNIAVAYFQDKQIQKAQEIFEKLHLEYPDNLKVLYNLATIAKSKNDVSQAIKYFENFRKISRQDKSVNFELAELYYQTKSHEKVIKIGDETLLFSDEKMQLLKAKSLVHSEKFSQAIKLLTQINSHKPNNNEVLLLLAKLFSQVPDKTLRNGEQSLKFARNAFVNESNQLSYWQLLMALDETKNCDEMNKTIVDFAQYIKVDKQLVNSRFSLQRGNELRCKIDQP